MSGGSSRFGGFQRMKLQMKSEEQVEGENGVGQDMKNNWL